MIIKKRKTGRERESEREREREREYLLTMSIVAKESKIVEFAKPKKA